MIIKKLKLENYTVFENQQIEFNPGINVFIGENGTGKSTLLSIIAGKESDDGGKMVFCNGPGGADRFVLESGEN